jgi:hypothetical protein
MEVITTNYGDILFNDFNSIKNLSTTIHIDFFPNTDDKTKYNLQYLTDICDGIMNKEKDYCNKINFFKIRNMIQNIILNTIDKYTINNILNNICMTFCKNLKKKIQTILSNKIVNVNELLDLLIEQCNKYKESLKFIKKNILWYYDTNTISTKNLTDYCKTNDKKYINYSVIDIMSNEIIYKYIFNIKYLISKSNSDSHVYLSIFDTIKYLITSQKCDNININKLLSFYDIGYYNFVFIYVNNGQDRQKKESNSGEKSNFDFLLTFGDNINFIKKIMLFIDNKIRNNEYSIKDFNSKSKFSSGYFLPTEFKLLTRLIDKEMMYLFYYKLLSSRLLTNSSNINMELYIINIKMGKFLYLMDMKNIICRKIKTMILDIKKSNREQYIYNNLKVGIGSEKYKNLNSNINQYKFKLKTLSNFAWNKIFDKNINKDKSKLHKYPIEIDMYKDIYKQYTNLRYPNKKIIFLLENGSSILELYFNDEKYLFKVTNVQANILLRFNDGRELSIYDLHHLTNIPVIQINEIINSFLKGIPTLLLIKEKENSIYYKINEHFSFESKNISFINYNEIISTEKQNLLVNNREIIKDIVKIIEACFQKEIKEDELFKNKFLLNKYGNEKIKNIIKSLILNKYIFTKKDLLGNNNYKLSNLLLNDSSDDDSSSDEESNENQKINSTCEISIESDNKTTVNVNKKITDGTKILNHMMSNAGI